MSRSKWKGPYFNIKYSGKLNLISRDSEIIPKFLGLTFKIYNGKNFLELIISENMIGHKFGEFVFTRGKFTFKKKKQKPKVKKQKAQLKKQKPKVKKQKPQKLKLTLKK